jgi:hypothetical protein
VWRDCLIGTIQELDKDLTAEELAIWSSTIDIITAPIGVSGE